MEQVFVNARTRKLMSVTRAMETGMRKKVYIGILLAAVAAFVISIARRPSGDVGAAASFPGRSSSPDGDPGQVKRDRDSRPVASASSSKLSSSDLEKLMSHFARSPESIVLSYIASGDPALLAELKRHPGSKAALTMLAYRCGDANERLFWAKKLKKLDPENGLASMLISNNLFALGRGQEAFAEVALAEKSPFIRGNMQEVSALLPEAGSVMPKGCLESFVLGDLGTARVMAIRSMFPRNYSDVLSGKPQEEMLATARSYLAICDKVSQGGGFSISDDPIRKNSVGFECKSQRNWIITTVERLGGREASSLLSSLSAKELGLEQLADYQRATADFSSMKREEIDKIVTSVFQAGAR